MTEGTPPPGSVIAGQFRFSENPKRGNTHPNPLTQEQRKRGGKRSAAQQTRTKGGRFGGRKQG